MIKVLHLIDNIGIGGAQVYLKGIAEANSKNIKHFVFPLNRRKYEIVFKEFYRHRSYNRFSFSTKKKIIEFIKDNKIDIIHCHLFKSSVMGYLIKRFHLPNIKLIIHEHGPILFRPPIYYTGFLNLSEPKVDRFICVSNTTANALIKGTNIKQFKTSVVYNYIPRTSIMRTRNKYRKFHKDYEVKIGFLGRLSFDKGCDILIDSLNEISSNVKIIIGGDGPEADNLLKTARRSGFSDKIQFLGYIKDVKKFLKDIDILIVPSRSESFGITGLEAQVNAIPVIVSDIKSIKEIFGTTCLSFSCCNPMSLGRQIDILIQDNTLRNNLITTGIENSRKFNFIKCKNSLENIYKTI